MSASESVAPPGARPNTHKRFIFVATLANGLCLSIPVLEINGAQEGPRVGITATIHGDEIVGLQILRELWDAIDPKDLRGCLWLMPVANPLAFESLTRNTPLDMLDLNRVFPGDKNGWLSEQIAWCISEEFLNHLDFYIDLHAGGTFPTVDYCHCLNCEGLSRSFLSKLLYRPPQAISGTSVSVTISRGIRTAVVEVGGGYLQQEQYVARGLRGFTNMLKFIGVLPGIPKEGQNQILLKMIKVLRPRNGGLCVPHGKHLPGTTLEGQSKLADILCPYTFERLETLAAPFEKNVIVLSRSYATRINPGDFAFIIGDLSTADQL
jgi:predicted deacylase